MLDGDQGDPGHRQGQDAQGLVPGIVRTVRVPEARARVQFQAEGPARGKFVPGQVQVPGRGQVPFVAGLGHWALGAGMFWTQRPRPPPARVTRTAGAKALAGWPARTPAAGRSGRPPGARFRHSPGCPWLMCQLSTHRSGVRIEPPGSTVNGSREKALPLRVSTSISPPAAPAGTRTRSSWLDNRATASASTWPNSTRRWARVNPEPLMITSNPTRLWGGHTRVTLGSGCSTRNGFGTGHDEPGAPVPYHLDGIGARQGLVRHPHGDPAGNVQGEGPGPGCSARNGSHRSNGSSAR